MMEKFNGATTALKAWLQQIGCFPLMLRNKTASLLAEQGLLLPPALHAYFRVTDRAAAAELKVPAGHLVLISTASAFLDQMPAQEEDEEEREGPNNENLSGS